MNYLKAKAAVTILTAALPMAAATADPVEALACLRANIALEPVGFGADTVDQRAVTIRITNDTDKPLGGVWVAFTIWAEGRPQPLYEGSIREAATIPGALMPGESMVAQDFHFMDDRTKDIARNAPALRLAVSVDNAADGDMRGFLPDPRMANWSNVLTDTFCAPRIKK